MKKKNSSGSELSAKVELSKTTAWKILIVDDEQATHSITKSVLKDLVFLGKAMSFESVYSGAQAKDYIKFNPDTALILLDIVMETERAGLEVVKYIREELQNREVRIVLRTAYPGSAPEQKVIIEYDINDYKDKTELFSQKLITCVITALRTYNDIKTIAELNKDLERKVAERTRELEESNLKLAETLKLLRQKEKKKKK
jgi:CheY-like chemotaxis protein